MKHMHWSFVTLLEAITLIEPSIARSVPHNNFMTRGQGYNTFEGKGARHGVVRIYSNADYWKRDQSSVPPNAELNLRRNGLFNFTGPSGDTTGVDKDLYFTPPDPDIIDRALDEKPEARGNSNGTRKFPFTKRSFMQLERPCSGRITRTADFVSDYTEYLRSLDISASSVISGWGQSAAISGGYLDEARFSSNTLTYVSTVEVQKQQNPDEAFEFDLDSYYREQDAFTKVFGNRWIRGFDRGGKLIIRVSITAKDRSAHEDIAANAEASFSALGFSGGLSSTAKTSVAKLSKQAKVKVDIFYEGGIGYELKSMSTGNPDITPVERAIEEAQSWTDNFLEDACKHNYNYRALLEEYHTVPGFPQEQAVWDYDVAERAAFSVLAELVKISELARIIQKSNKIHEDMKALVSDSESDMIEASKYWIRMIAADPRNARHTARLLIKHFRTNFYSADINLVRLD